MEPIEIIERVTNDTHDSLRSSIKAQKGATKADEIRGEGLRVKLPKIRLPKDGKFVSCVVPEVVLSMQIESLYLCAQFGSSA